MLNMGAPPETAPEKKTLRRPRIIPCWVDSRRRFFFLRACRRGARTFSDLSGKYILRAFLVGQHGPWTSRGALARHKSTNLCTKRHTSRT